MTYATSNPPMLSPAGPLTGPGKTWIYRSTDAATDVDASGYFTNGDDLGMEVGDLVQVTDTDDNSTTLHRVTTVTAGGAATVSATGTNIA